MGFYDDIDDGSSCVFETCEDVNASFSDYDWASESVGFEPRACPEDDEEDTALIVGLSVGGGLLCCVVLAVVAFIYFKKAKLKAEVDPKTTDDAGNAGQTLTEQDGGAATQS